MPDHLQDQIENIGKNRRQETADFNNISPKANTGYTSTFGKNNITNLPLGGPNVLKLEPIDSPDRLKSVTFRLNEAEEEAQVIGGEGAKKFGLFEAEIIEKILSKDWKVNIFYSGLMG